MFRAMHFDAADRPAARASSAWSRLCPDMRCAGRRASRCRLHPSRRPLAPSGPVVRSARISCSACAALPTAAIASRCSPIDRGLKKPSWITWRNAADIVPAERVVRESSPSPANPRFTASLFRHALLHRYGGWWIDPDVVLLGTELPDAEMFVARSEDGRLVSAAAMKFPEGHATLAEVLFQSRCRSTTSLSNGTEQAPLCSPNASPRMACSSNANRPRRSAPSRGSMSRCCSIRRAPTCSKRSCKAVCFSICIRRSGCGPACRARSGRRSAPISTGFSNDTRSDGRLPRASNMAICGVGWRTCITRYASDLRFIAQETAGAFCPIRDTGDPIRDIASMYPITAR